MRENLKSLTSLRFFAAALIVISHSGYFGFGRDWIIPYPMGMAVSFFFVLSGFVLFYANPSIASVKAACDFLVSRFARIWPAHFAMLAIVVLFLPNSWGDVWDVDATIAFLKNALLIQSWSHTLKDFFSFNGVSWSISTEMFFYAMFPILIWRWKRTGAVKLLLGGLLAIACIASAANLSLAGAVGPTVESIEGYVYVFPPARLFEFLIGMVVADIWTRTKSSGLSTAKATVLQLISIYLLVSTVPSLYMIYAGWSQTGLISDATFKWLSGSGYLFINAFAIFSMACMNGLVAKILSNRVLVFLGEISFSIYLCHQVLLTALMGKLATFGSMPMQYFIFWVIVIAFSSAIYVFIEKPCKRMIVSGYRNNISFARRPDPAMTHVPNTTPA